MYNNIWAWQMQQAEQALIVSKVFMRLQLLLLLLLYWFIVFVLLLTAALEDAVAIRTEGERAQSGSGRQLVC